MINKHQVRENEFAMRREWAEKQSSTELRKMLVEKTLGAGKATAAREVLRARNEDPLTKPKATTSP